MKILLFGVTNVGKTTIGEALAQKLKYSFYDLDEEIKKKYHYTLTEFYQLFIEREVAHEYKMKALDDILYDHESEDMVIAITPLHYMTYIEDVIKDKDTIAIQLTDSPQHIYDRLVFTDDDDNIYKDDEYKEDHKTYYINDIRKDIYYWNEIYKDIEYRYFVNNKTVEQVAGELAYMINHHIPITEKVKLEDIIDIINNTNEEYCCLYYKNTHELDYIEDSNVELGEYAKSIGIIKVPYYDIFFCGEDQGLGYFIDHLEDEAKRDELLNGHYYYIDDELKKLGLDEQWNEYEKQQIKLLAIKWCNDNDIEYE